MNKPFEKASELLKIVLFNGRGKKWIGQMAPWIKLKRNISKVGNKCNNTVHLICVHSFILCFLFILGFDIRLHESQFE